MAEIINTYDQLMAAKAAHLSPLIAVSYTTRNSRACQPPCSHVYSPFFKTDPKAHWTDNGCKAFVGNRAESLPLALAWAKEHYGLTDPVRNRMGDYVQRAINERFPLRKQPK